MRIGIDLGGTKIETVVLDAEGREAWRHRVPAPQGDYEATLRAIAGEIEAAEGAVGGVDPFVGLGIPGVICPASGLVKNANSTWLIGRPLDRDLAELLGRPVRVENDANCFALSEALDGAAAGVWGVLGGRGGGGGGVGEGKVLTGANAVAGEWGHSPLPWPEDGERPGARCYCGKRGCIETFLSGPGFARDHRECTGEDLSPPEIARRAGEGDPGARATLERYTDRMARSLATVINLLDPDVIVLGGGMSKVRSLYDEVPRRWGRYVFSDRVVTRLLPPAHGDASGVRGAARLPPGRTPGLH